MEPLVRPFSFTTAPDPSYFRSRHTACVVHRNEPDTSEPAAADYFGKLLDFARTLDPQGRPITIEGDNGLAFHAKVKTDILSIHSCKHRSTFPAVLGFNHSSLNSLRPSDAGSACCLLTDAGWYDYAPLPAIADDMSDFISSWLKAFADTPVVVSEYGAGAISGMHHEPPIQYSEELQVLKLQLLLGFRRSARADLALIV